ncbi:MAG: GAF domain-containing protein [Anaerolineales bacterium]|nr:GAF domain-containing protein [Anaerolineales bacterium]
MLAGQSVQMAIGLLVTGLVFLLLVWAALRFLPRLRPAQSTAASGILGADGSGHDYAALVVQSGGRVVFTNETAKQYFSLREGEFPNLELLARRIRPSEEFLKLCNTEGQARFSVNGRPMEGVSYRIPGSPPALMVSLRRPEIAMSVIGDTRETSGSVVRILTEFNQGVAINLGLTDTIQAVLENVERLIPADLLQVFLWDAEEQKLTPYRFAAGSGSERRLQQGSARPARSYSAYLVDKRAVLFIPDTQVYTDIPYEEGGEHALLRSYIGLPFIVGKDFIGALEVGLTSADAFSQEDADILGLVVGQAAVAIRNAILLEQEQQRSAELSGLANLAQALGSARDPRDLFARLVESIAPLFDVSILGFLVYNENRRELEAQVPFTGMPSQFVELYHVPVPSGSVVEDCLLRHEMLVTQNAQDDEAWHEMGFQDFARAASWRDAVLVPLVSAGRSLGYLQVANHQRPEAVFTADELRLLNIVANQAAPIIDNVTLVLQARQRAQRSEALRRIASLTGSSATADEMLRYTVQELARLLQADVASVMLLNEAQGLLRLHTESLFGMDAAATELFTHIYENDPQYHFTVTGSQRSFLAGHLSNDQRLLTVYRPLADELNMQSVLIVPLVVRERSLGELILASHKVEAFNNYDLQVVSTAAGQLAAAVESASLTEMTDESLRRQVDHLTAMIRIGRELNTTLEWKYLLQVVYDESLRTTRADCGTILLFEAMATAETEPQVVFHIGDAPGPEGLLPIEREVLTNSAPIVVADFSQGDYQPPHAQVQSAIVAPIAYQEQTIGLIHLHSSEAAQFDEAAVDIITTLAVQAAIALGNAQRYQEQVQRNEQLNRRAETLSKLFETTRALELDQPLENSLEALAYGIQEATPFQVVLFSIIDRETGLQRRVAGVGMPLETLSMLKATSQPYASVEQLLRDEFKIGNGYFIPHDQRPVLSGDVQVVTVMSSQTTETPNAWHPEDMLFFTLKDGEGVPVGLISLDSPRDGLRPDRTTLETIEIFAAQAALMIRSGNRLSSYKYQVDTLSVSVDRQQQLLSIGQTHLPILLHKDLEQMIAIRNLERRARRIRAGLEITETINRQVDRPSALQALGREILTRLEMSVSIVAENTTEGPRMLHVLGNVPRGTSPEALFGQRNPLRYSLQNGEMLLVMNLEEDDTWRDAPLLTSLHAKGFICLPILIEEKPVAGILAISREPMPPLTDEDRQVYVQISRQVSIILQNISLLTETRRRLREVNLLLDFSRQLSGLDPERIVQALLDSALRVVAVAHAGAVLVWNEQEETLIPRAAANYANNERLMQIAYRAGEALPGQVFSERKSRRVDDVNFARDYNLAAENLLLYREATGGRLPVSSLLVPIQTGERILGLLVLDNFNTSGAFSADDEALLLSLTQQVALSIENVRLVDASQERATQLQALTDVSTDMASSLQSDELVAGLLDQLHTVLDYDTAILWLRQGNAMNVAAARGFPDNEERIGLSVAIEDSALLNEMITTMQGLVVGDVRGDPRFPALTAAERLSWMGIPLVSKGEVVGVLALEKTEAHFYTVEYTQLVTTFASQAAVAIENARLFEESLRRATELDERSQRLALLNRLSTELSGSLSEEQILLLTAEELHKALSARRVSAVTFDRQGIPVLTVVVPQKKKHQVQVLPDAPIFERLRESLGVFTTTDVANEPDLAPLEAILNDTHTLLILPLASGTNLRALQFVHMTEAYRFTSTEIELARTISNQAAIALESARLYQDTVSRAEQLTTINRASYEIALSLDPEEIYMAIHRAASGLMVAESFVIALLDEERGEIEGVYLMDPNGRSPNIRLPLGEGLSGRVIAQGEPLLIADVAAQEEFDGRTYGQGQPRSIIAVPITLGGKVIGMLSAQSYQPNVYVQDDLPILGTLANQAAVAIQNGRLFAETRRLADELEQRVVERTAELAREQHSTETLLRILTEVSASLDLDRALNRTLALLNDAIGAEQGSILMVNPEDNTIQYRAGYGYVTPVMTEGARPTTLKVGEGLAGWVIKNRQSVLLDDVLKDKRWVKLPANAPQHRSVISAPLMVGEEVIGAIMVFHRQIDYFTHDHMNLVQAIGSQVAVAINNAHLYELIRDQAERLGSMLRNQQVEASRQQAILEAVADGVLVTDPDDRITFINSSIERILTLQGEQVRGKPLDYFVGLFGKAAQTWMQTIRAWSEDPSTYQPGDTYAEQLTLESGRVVLVHLAPVIWRNEFLGTVSIFRDITHEVEVDRLKSEFVATVSHELRTPMTSIKGYVDILLMGAAGALNENQVHFLDIVRSNTDRLSILVNDLLDISRIEAGRVAFNFQGIELRGVAEESIADLLRRSQEENRPMALTVDAAPELPQVTGDPERVRQIIDNLVDNAYHYTPENGQITIHIHREGDEVQVDVKDSGVGIDLVDQERIFDRFFRGEHPLVLATPGTGLGLSIVKQLVEAHKGRIWMTSNGIPGEGSTFSFTLPVYQAEE